MNVRAQLGLVFLLPVLLGAGLMATGQRVELPVFGRDYVLRIPLEELKVAATLPQVVGPDGPQYPLLVIDAGHGGFDYGATGAGYREKDLVLGLTLALRDRLVEANDIRVALTRDGDRFLPLDERLAIARELDADLLLSIHADSAGEASEVTGASIYTLSDSASSRVASQFAARENAAGELSGIEVSSDNRVVNDILVELSRRQTQEISTNFAQLIERSGEGLIRFHPQTQRSASLVVLRSPDVPSVLFEAGFVTNERDAQTLASKEGRADFAEAMARAVRAHFVRQSSSNLAGDS